MLPHGIQPACVVFQNDVIESVAPPGGSQANLDVIDYGDQYVLPGLIDSHIHINDPGRADWEGFESATRAAAAGGFTCLVDMPLNSIPATTSVPDLEAKRDAARGHSTVDYRFWGGAVRGNALQLRPLAESGVAGFKAFMVHPGVDEFSMVDETDLRQAMPIIAQLGLPLLVHAELAAPMDAAPPAPGPWRNYATYLRSRPDECEIEAIRLLIRLCASYRCHVHIVHLSSTRPLGEIRQARENGLPITLETCPHYLYFSAEEIAAGNTAMKCAPPIRGQSNRDELWEAVRGGEIDLIATDHSPCPIWMKKLESGDFKQAWGGISSVSVALSAFWTKALERDVSMAHVARLFCERPAQLAGVSSIKGKIAVGYHADFAIFDANESWRVSPDDLHFKNKFSPYLGEYFRGRITATYLRGERVYSLRRLPNLCCSALSLAAASVE